MKKHQDTRLFLIFVVAVVLVFLSQTVFETENQAKNSGKMRQASMLAESWMKLIQREKESRNLLSVEAHHFPSEALLGKELSEITTTIGSLDAKKISVNPQFAVLVVHWITEINLDSTDEVLVASSGSFPGIAVSTLAALQTMNQRAVLITSVGASSYGANQTEMTIIDIEKILAVRGNLRYTPKLITYGCDNDNGDGFFEGGKEAVDSAAVRNGVILWQPSTLEEAITKRVEIAVQHHTKLLINIGGNHALLGNCAHASSIPNGLHRLMQTCRHTDRGAIARISERGIPTIHFLNIMELGLRYGITDSYIHNEALYVKRSPNNIAVSIFLFTLVVAVVKIGKIKKV